MKTKWYKVKNISPLSYREEKHIDKHEYTSIQEYWDHTPPTFAELARELSGDMARLVYSYVYADIAKEAAYQSRVRRVLVSLVCLDCRRTIEDDYYSEHLEGQLCRSCD
jgi:hypothetical protein